MELTTKQYILSHKIVTHWEKVKTVHQAFVDMGGNYFITLVSIYLMSKKDKNYINDWYSFIQEEDYTSYLS